MKLSNILWGILLIIVGVIIGLNALEITSINIFFDGWWTLFIIVPCFIDSFKDANKTGDFIGMAIGVFLLLACQDIISFGMIWKLLFPALLVIIGLSLIFKDTFEKGVKKKFKELNKKNKDLHEYCATFGGQDLVFENEKFDGASLTSVFGGVKCDLTDAILKDETLIEVCAIFGGVTIIVPDDVNVKIVSTPIFGGASDERKSRKKGLKESNKTVYINATCVFGGVEVK